jgi:hypothetical protein
VNLLKHTSFHNLFVAVAALLSLVLMSGTAQAQVCAPNAENIIELSAAYAPKIREQIRKEYEVLVADISKVGAAALSAEKKAIATTNTNFQDLASQARQLQTQTEALKKRIQSYVNRLTHSESEAGRNVLDIYFKVVSSLSNVMTATNPMGISMNWMKSTYGVQLSAAARNSIYPTANEMPAGTEMTTLSAKPTYRISLSSSMIFEAMVRAVATSKLMQKYSKAYLETARCTLGRIVLAKYQVHRVVLGENMNTLPVSAQQLMCSQTRVSEFNDFITREADEVGEIVVREQIGAALPNALRNLSNQALTLINENPDIAEKYLALYAYPDMLATEAAGSDPKILDTLIAETKKSMTLNDKQNPAFAKLKSVWKSNSMRALAQKIHTNMTACRFRAMDELLTPITLSQMLDKFVLTEDIVFTSMLESEIGLASLSFSRQSPERLSGVIKDYIINIKVRAMKEAILAFLHRASDDYSLDRYSFVAALDNEIERAARAEIKNRWPQTGLDAELNKIASSIHGQTATKNRFDIKSFLMSKSLHEKALDVNKIMSPTTPIKELGFDRGALVRIFTNEINALSAPNRMRMNFALGEENPSLKVKIWSELQARVLAQAKHFGVTCSANSKMKSFYLGARDFFGIPKATTNADIAQSDCYSILRLGKFLALGQINNPKNISHIIEALRPIVSSKELNEFVANYREEVASAILSEYRLLDAQIDAKNKKSPQLYIELAKQISANRGKITDQLVQRNLPLIKSIVKRALPALEHELIKVVNAKTAQDLSFFITRTKVINRLLGEDENGNNNSEYLEGFGFVNTLPDDTDKAVFNSTQLITAPGLHFPELLKYHQKLQREMVRKEDVAFENWNEFLSIQGTVAMWVLGGWGAKWALGYLPKFTGGPMASHYMGKLVFSPLSRTINAHGRLMMPVFVGSIGGFELQKRNYQSQLNSVTDLTRSDALNFGTVTSTMPLISWSDYSQQKKYFTANIAQLKKAQYMTAGFLAASVAISYAPRLKIMSRPLAFLDKRAIKIATSGSKNTTGFEKVLTFQINALKNRLAPSFSILGKPKSIDISTLIAARDAALAKTGPGFLGRLKAERINNAYKNIIGEIGERVWRYQQYPQLNKSMNRILFGPRADETQISRWYAEYKRLYGDVI